MASSSTTSRRHRTALVGIDGYNSWTIVNIMGPRAPECIHAVLSTTINRPEMDNASYQAYFCAMVPLFRNFHVHVHEILEDPKGNKVVMHARGSADTPIGPYVNEYMLMIHFNDKCNKAVRIVEWVDSAATLYFFSRLKQHLESQAAASSYSSASCSTLNSEKISQLNTYRH